MRTKNLFFLLKPYAIFKADARYMFDKRGNQKKKKP